MAKKSTRRRHHHSRSAAGHRYHNGQRPNQWLVPLQADGYACFYHGHDDADDHRLCGPQIFCCHKAASQFLAQYPDMLPATMTLNPMSPDSLLAWHSPTGPQVFYFYYCDPINRQRVYFQGFSPPLLQPVLRFERPLSSLIVNAIVVV